MPDILHLDYETYSESVLKKVGAYRYAADPSARILMCAIALNDEEPRILLPQETLDAFGMEQDAVALQWASRLTDESVEVYAHNAGFEIALCTHRLEQDLGLASPAIEQWRCTAAIARRAALPSGLADLTAILNLDQQKDKKGSALIKLFSSPQTAGKAKGTRILPQDRPEEFREFIRYCLQDVRSEQAVLRCLSAFVLKGALLRSWILDCKLNARGVPVNVPALCAANVIVKDCQGAQGELFRAITGLNYTQLAKVKVWLEARGYKEEDMTAVSVTRALEDTSWATGEDRLKTVEALALKADLGYSAVNKIPAMLGSHVGGVVRGTLLWYGAGPGRWAGKLIQPQNFKRPTFSDTQEAYAALCAGEITTADDMALLFGPPLDVLSSCIRHFLQLPDGQMMLDADYAAIEARIVCWLAGQMDALERFRKYDETGSKEFDSYVIMAATIFNKQWRDVSKDERWLGKQTVLGCGFQMWVDKFLSQCLVKAEQYGIKGIQVDEALAMKAVTGFRDDYDQVKQLWYDADRAARNAILNPGRTYKAGPHLSFGLVRTGGVPFLAMRLPSGRSIVYPFPALEPDPKRPGTQKITFYGKLPMKDDKWGRVSTYGGKLVENATQGTAADVMAHGACNAVARGFDVLTLIHDQALAAAGSHTSDQFCEALTDTPSWATGLPVKAEGKLVPYYLKL